MHLKAMVTLFDDRLAGPSKRVLEVAPELEDIETVLVLPEGQGNVEELGTALGIEVRRITMTRVPRPQQVTRLLRWLFRLPLDTLRLRRLFVEERGTLVHNSGAFFLAPSIAAKLARLPLLWHLNDTIVPRRFAPWLGRLVRWMADEIIVEGRAVARHYGIPLQDCEIVYAPVRTETFVRSDLRKRGLLAEPPVRIGLVANWTPIKGIHIFVEAMALVRQETQQPLELVFAGARWANHADYCRRVEERIDDLGLRSLVRDHGFVLEVQEVLSGLDLLVLSSSTEACPMVVLEGMAAGLPVVATDVGSVRELLNRDSDHEAAGVIVQPEDPAALARGVLDILDNPERAQHLGDNGRRLSRKYFSVEVSAQRHAEIYTQLVRQRKANHRG